MKIMIQCPVCNKTISNNENPEVHVNICIDKSLLNDQLNPFIHQKELSPPKKQSKIILKEKKEKITEKKKEIIKYLCLKCNNYYYLNELFYCNESCLGKICKNCLLKEVNYQLIEEGNIICKFCEKIIETKKMNEFLY